MTDRKQQNKEAESNEKNSLDQQVDPEVKLAGFLADQAGNNFVEGDSVNYMGEEWIVVAQSHDPYSGFDGYLFYNERTKKFVVSFRGTEFKLNDRGYKDFSQTDIHDYGRSNLKMAQLESAKTFMSDVTKIVNGDKTAVEKVQNKIEENQKKPVDLPITPGAASEKTSAKKAAERDDRLIIVGHSLGGGLAQLIGAMSDYAKYQTHTFNAIGGKELYNKWRRKAIKLIAESEGRRRTFKEIFMPGTINISFNDERLAPLWKDIKFSGDFSNITNHKISNDGVSNIYDQLGSEIVYKPAQRNRLKPKDILPLYYTRDENGKKEWHVFPGLVKIFKSGHDSKNFLYNEAGSFELETSRYTFSNLMKIYRALQGDEVLENLVAPWAYYIIAGGHKSLIYLKKLIRGEDESETAPKTTTQTVYGGTSPIIGALTTPSNHLATISSQIIKETSVDELIAEESKSDALFNSFIRSLAPPKEKTPSLFQDLDWNLIKEAANYFSIPGSFSGHLQVPSAENIYSAVPAREVSAPVNDFSSPSSGVATGYAAPLAEEVPSTGETGAAVGGGTSGRSGYNLLTDWELDDHIRYIMTSELDNFLLLAGYEISNNSGKS